MIASQLRRWTRSALDLLSPRVCRLCLVPLPAEFPAPVCASCGTDLDREPARAVPLAPASALDHVCATGAYRGRLRDAVLRFKFDPAPELAPILAERMLRPFSTERRPDVIVAVPMHPHRVRERGFNPAAFLARELGRRLSVATTRDAIRRVRHSAPNSRGLGRGDRRRALRDAFTRGADPVVDADVLLVDDVFTSGSTAEACAHALREAGAARIRAAVLAYTEPS